MKKNTLVMLNEAQVTLMRDLLAEYVTKTGKDTSDDARHALSIMKHTLRKIEKN